METLKNWVVILVLGTVLAIFIYHNKKEMEKPISKAEVRAIYAELTKYTGLPKGNIPKLEIIDSDIINAYMDSNSNTIGIYTGIIKFAKSKDEVAGILGHELAHFMLQHGVLLNTEQYSDNYSAILEGNADKFSVYLLTRAGYNECRIKELWERLREKDGDIEVGLTHPNYSYRVWQLEFPNCYN